MKLIRILLFSIIILFPTFTYAEQQLTVEVNPTTPAPYDKVSINLSSYSFDISNSLITWKVSGKTFASGNGVKSINIKTLGVGESIPVSIKITTPQGEEVDSTVNIIPQAVDLLWESNESYVPAFYEGKALPGEGSSIHVTALPNISSGGTQIPSNNLSYSWYLNGELVQDVSGYGKSSADFSLDYLSTKTDIKVSVRSKDGLSSDKTISVYPHDVMPLFYTYNEILGTNFSQLLDRRFETTKEITLSLVPYYLSNRGSLLNSSIYEWFLDGLSVTPKEKTLLSLVPKENSVGTKTLSVSISNAARRLQKAENSLTILFDTRK